MSDGPRMRELPYDFGVSFMYELEDGRRTVSIRAERPLVGGETVEFGKSWPSKYTPSSITSQVIGYT